MYDTDVILNKINISATRSGSDSNQQVVQLSTLMPYSFAELWPRYKGTLTWGEMNYLNLQVQKARRKNKEEESRILSRANPQLTRAVRLAITQASTLRDYNTQFANRTQKYVRPGTVSSMFSPAGYLTELYREARDLHAADSERHLDNRRPDIARLALSQQNMDTELSTLKIANEILLSNIASREGISNDEVLEKLSTWRLSGTTPYHSPYESARQAILLRDPKLEALLNNPDIAQQIDLHSLLAIYADISPELYTILTEEITEENAGTLYEANFGDQETDQLLNIAQLAAWYDLPADDLFNLTSLITRRDFSAPIQYYHNGVVTSLVASEDNSIGQINQVVRNGMLYTFNYVEILPQGGDNYLINFNLKERMPEDSVLNIGSNGGTSSDLYNGPYPIPTNGHVSVPVTLSTEKLRNSITLVVNVYPPGAGYYYFNYAYFKLNTLSPEQYLLQLNKIIRLYKACQFTPEEMSLLLYNNPGAALFDPALLTTAFLTHYYRQRYALGMEEALILAGGYISTLNLNDGESFFDTLFNSPPLSDRDFIADGVAVDWSADTPDDIFRASAIKRGLGVQKADLRVLWQLAAGDNTGFTASTANLALLARVNLLARVHGLTATGLSMLLAVSPWNGTALSALDATAFSTLVNYVYSTTVWLREQGWTVAELYLMLTTRYSTLLTPDIENLISSLRSAVSEEELSSAPSLITLLAPFFATTGQIDLTSSAESILTWLDQLKPGGTDLATFMSLVMKDDRTDEETTRLVIFCQVLGQLTLLVRRSNISDYLLTLLVANPALFHAGDTTMPLTADTLRLLTRVSRRIGQTGEYAGQLITALEQGTLDAGLLAQALAEEPLTVTQALALADSGAGEAIRDLKTLDLTLQWLDFSAALNCSPSTAAALLALKYVGSTAAEAPGYADWLAVSNQLQAGLTAAQTTALHHQLDELLSAALSGYYIRTVENPGVDTREALYAWLLIDGLVSSDVTTTRIAEAIAGVQLYVNRCQNDLEPDVERAVLTRQFFTDWDTYNKRYSTWAGVSRLVYYPENYIDPTIRTGQTSMMDEMLQSIGQSELTQETVEDAFRTYMTRFEKIANLNIISAYHESATLEEGRTWFIGKSTTEGEKYYWRALQQDKLSNGRYPATAWSEWLEIGTAIAAYNDLVRPVIFNDRLYVVWVTTQAVAAEVNGTVTEQTDYFISFSYIRHDGTWSAPGTRRLSELLTTTELAGKKMYCSNYDNNQLLTLFYTPQATPAGNESVALSGFSISPEHEFTGLNDAAFFDDRKSLDTLDVQVVNSPYFSSQYYAQLLPDNGYYAWGDYELSYVSRGKLYNPQVAEDTTSGTVTVTLDAGFTYNIDGYTAGGAMAPVQFVDLMKRFGEVGDRYYYFLTQKNIHGSSDSMLFAIYRFSDGDRPGQFLVMSNTANPFSSVDYYIGSSTDESIKQTWVPDNPGQNVYAVPVTQAGFTDADAGTLNRIHVFLTNNYGNYDSVFTDAVEVSTAVPAENVLVTFSAGGVTKSFTAADAIDSGSLPAASYNPSYYFSNLTFEIPAAAFINDVADVDVILSATSDVGQSLGSQIRSLRVTRISTDKPVMVIRRTDEGAKYLQRGPYRTRINTLFARQLVARATQGIDAVLSMETQQLPEPKLGKGNYVTITFPPYDPDIHGSNANITLGVSPAAGAESTPYPFWSGVLGDSSFSIQLYIPTSQTAYSDPVQFPENRDYGLGVFVTCQNGTYHQGMFDHILQSDLSLTKFTPSSDANTSLDVRIEINSGQQTEPMDFAGANALYFWEMFFYVPSMVFQRLLQESKFDEATTWMKYIWDPAGYYSSNGEPAPWTWNVRPLEEDTSWNPDPLDSVDPDAVAQADPMHYKVATFMRVLDLLIARGDAAYRLLERDTLNEAKMWYVQALGLLGDEPYDIMQEGGWSDPVLEDAASTTLELSFQQQLFEVRTWTIPAVETFTASSLLGLFYPQVNDKLTGYWQTLRQRLFNLRHNLSIDGEPLSLPVYSQAASPQALLSAAVAGASGGPALPVVSLSLLRFPALLDSARTTVNQLILFGNQLLSIIEAQDASALAELLQNQGIVLNEQSLQIQDYAITELDSDRDALLESRQAAEKRRDTYAKLYDENVNAGEAEAIDLYFDASVTATTGSALFFASAALDMVPNIYGVAMGGSRYGSLLQSAGIETQVISDGFRIAADKISQSEIYRRRREEWEIQRNNAQGEIKQFDAQLAALSVRREAAVLQKEQIKLQLQQTGAQLEFLQGKYSNQALYSWLRGTLSAIYYQFYDVAVTRSMQAQRAWQWGFNDTTTTFIRPGGWVGTRSGFMAGETLMLGLAKMEQAWIEKDFREREVIKTVSLAELYGALPADSFTLADKVAELVNSGSGSAGSGGNTLAVNEGQLQASIKLSDLNIQADHDASLGAIRRIKQISVTLPLLIGPYQDIRAVLSYGGSVILPSGCQAMVVSHGMNDSGLFQLDFNDPRWLPFEGIPVDDSGTLTLSLLDSDGKQKTALLSLVDIVFHILYTIKN
ncbi:neuraminidase-like domain-containing protein [Salmonella enterica]